MGNYIVTDKVLKRYHKGLCTADESAAVESWLQDTEDEIDIVHDQQEEEAINVSLWAAIQTSTIVKDRRKYNLKLWHRRIAVAASLLVTLSCAFLIYSRLNNSTARMVRINNFDGQRTDSENIDGLILTSLPQGSMGDALNQSSAEVKYCNVMLIQNTSVADVSLNFDSGYPYKTTGSKRFICKKGVTYVALRMCNVSQEIIVVDQRYMEDLLPLNVAMKINKDLQSI